MGTTCTNKPKDMPLEQFFIEHGVLRWGDDLPHRYTVLASGYKAPCFYAAVERVHKKTGERIVWAAVIKITHGRGDYGFCYKDMSEDMGPYYYDCPAKVLDLLTPTESEYAKAWRAKCRERLKHAAEVRARKIEAGSVLVYGGRRYAVLEKQPRGYYLVKCHESRCVYRMRPGQVRQATLEAATPH